MMSVEIVKIFFDKLLTYNSHKHYITLFWWEPLLNKKAIYFICDYLEINKKHIVDNNLEFEMKIVTNWTLIDDEYIEIFKRLKKLKFVNLIIDISIDWDRSTQLTQRPSINRDFDYFDKLKDRIKVLSLMNIKLDLFLVMDFFNQSLKEDVMFLLKTFKVPVFLMPVDLSYEYIIDNKENIYSQIYNYLLRVHNLLIFLKRTWLFNKIANFRTKKFRDIKLPPIWPTIDYNWDIYVTRDFLFLMDKESYFKSIWTIFTSNFDEIVSYILDNYNEIEKDSLYKYYWRTYNINKKIWDYFTNLVFKK